MRQPLFLLSILAISGVAEAANFCPGVSQFKRPIKSCEDNFSLGDAAMNCIEKFEASIQVGQSKVKSMLSAQVNKMKDQQSGSYQTSDASYNDAKNQLLNLIANGLQAQAAVTEYLAEMKFPDDYEQPSVTGMSSEEYLKQEPCFSAPLEVIEGSKDLIGKMVADLEKSAIAAGLKSQASQGHEANVGSLKNAPLKTGGVGDSGKAPVGKKIRSSDITGTEEKPKNP